MSHRYIRMAIDSETGHILTEAEEQIARDNPNIYTWVVFTPSSSEVSS
jgi:hypothetical protein